MVPLPIAIFNFEGEVQESNLRPLPEMVLRLSAALSSHLKRWRGMIPALKSPSCTGMYILQRTYVYLGYIKSIFQKHNYHIRKFTQTINISLIVLTFKTGPNYSKKFFFHMTIHFYFLSHNASYSFESLIEK